MILGLLEDVYKAYRKEADKVNWQKYNQNELFREYIKHENDDLAEKFYSGIVCRFWGYCGKIYNQCNKHVTFEQCYDILLDAINYVIKHRVWENPESSLYNDPTGPDKAFHIALKRERGILLSKLTAQKRQSNFNTLSIDEMYENYNDSTEGLFNLSEEEETICELTRNETELVEYIKKQSPLEIIILDQVCFYPWESKKNIISSLRKLRLEDYDKYDKIYKIPREDFIRVLLDFKNGGIGKIEFELNRILYKAKKEYCE